MTYHEAVLFHAKKIYLRNGNKTQFENEDNSIGEELMYRDIWPKETINWLYQRLLAIRQIMNDSASIYVHLDWHIGHYVKILLDEVFGKQNFQREIIWENAALSGYKTKTNNWIRAHDTIFSYSFSDERIFNKQKQPHKKNI